MRLSSQTFRRFGVWAGLLAFVLVTAVEIASVWFECEASDASGHIIGLHRGGAFLNSGYTRTDWHWRLGAANPFPEFTWWFSFWVAPTGPYDIWVPLWFVALMLGLLTFGLWWHDRQEHVPIQSLETPEMSGSET